MTNTLESEQSVIQKLTEESIAMQETISRLEEENNVFVAQATRADNEYAQALADINKYKRLAAKVHEENTGLRRRVAYLSAQADGNISTEWPWEVEG